MANNHQALGQLFCKLIPHNDTVGNIGKKSNLKSMQAGMKPADA